MGDESDNTREHGIEFGELATDLEDESYPLSHETLLSRYGDRELVLIDGQATVQEILSADTEQEYEDKEGVQQAILNMVGDEAVGREGYSDRGGSVEDDDGSAEAESF
jgi:hypothetical protein